MHVVVFLVAGALTFKALESRVRNPLTVWVVAVAVGLVIAFLTPAAYMLSDALHAIGTFFGLKQS